jgi:serine phosphatase RsbU (regulator of sigma subunit)
MGLQITVTPGDVGTYRIKLTGMLDTGTAPQLDEALKPVLADVAQFRGEAPQTDDVTMVVVKRTT